MVSVEEALAIVLRETPLVPDEEVALEDGLGRVLREDVKADVDLPPFDRSAMDGYALRADDVAAPPAALEVVGEVQAGGWPARAVGQGQAMRIMTGAPVPEGADAVQPVENTRPLDTKRVEVLSALRPGANIARRGSEACAGDQVMAAGRVLDPAGLAVLAALGRAKPRVARRPLVTLLPTGDELVAVEATPGPGRIRNSNGPALAALARLAGGEVRSFGVVPDRAEALAAAVARGLQGDVLVVSGGVSAGDYDLVEPALASNGVSSLFDGVAVKPGAPLVFGRRAETLVFGLPGNPVSAQVTFELFVRPCLLRMQGARVVVRPRVQVTLLSAVTNRSGRTSHLPARVRWEQGRLVARPVRSQGSGDLVAHARANALVVIERDREEVESGRSAEAVLLGSFLEDDGAPI